VWKIWKLYISEPLKKIMLHNWSVWFVVAIEESLLHFIKPPPAHKVSIGNITNFLHILLG
jgi:hypothetical protein